MPGLASFASVNFANVEKIFVERSAAVRFHQPMDEIELRRGGWRDHERVEIGKPHAAVEVVHGQRKRHPAIDELLARRLAADGSFEPNQALVDQRWFGMRASSA